MNIRPTRTEDAPALSKLAIYAVEPTKDLDFNSHGWERFVLANEVSETVRRINDDSCIGFLLK